MKPLAAMAGLGLTTVSTAWSQCHIAETLPRPRQAVCRPSDSLWAFKDGIAAGC